MIAITIMTQYVTFFLHVPSLICGEGIEKSGEEKKSMICYNITGGNEKKVSFVSPF